ncbi:MAG: hypothetical protein R6V44_13415 [Paracoccaceae bacterium]
MGEFDRANPAFRLFVSAAAVMTLMGRGRAAVAAMMGCRRGCASPEAPRPGAIDRAPDPSQVEADPAVERFRRMHRSDLDDVPGFLIAGLPSVAVAPPLRAVWMPMGGFAPARAGRASARGTSPLA